MSSAAQPLTELVTRRNRDSTLATSVNPFFFELPWSAYECFKLFVVGLTLGLVRVAVLLVTFVIGWLYALLLGICAGTYRYEKGLVFHSTPLSPWRQVLTWGMYFVCRIWHWCMGFWSIKVNDLRGPPFKQFSGQITGGADLDCKEMTVEEAKVHAKTMEECKGFCFEGEDTGGKLKIFFKSSWDVVESEGWTSFRVQPRPGMVVCAPHVSIADPFMMVAAFPPFPSAVGDMEITKGIGCLSMGVLGRINQTIFVDRFNPDSREKCKQELARRADPKQWKGDTIIFPEGTTTNGKHLIKFKDGAFLPGHPVQPVGVRYPAKFHPIAFTGQGKGPCLVIRMMTQFANFCEVDILEPYVPSAAEVEDSFLYAHNVRQVIATHLGVGTCEHTIADATLHNTGLHLRIGNMLENDFVIAEAVEKYGVESKMIREWLKEFGKFDHDGNGFISLTEFRQVIVKFASRTPNEEDKNKFSILPRLAAYLKSEKDEACDRIFKLFNTDRSEILSFREFVQALALLSDQGSSKLQGRRKLCFLLLNPGTNGTVPKATLKAALNDASSLGLGDDLLRQAPEEIDFQHFDSLVENEPRILQAVASTPAV